MDSYFRQPQTDNVQGGYMSVTPHELHVHINQQHQDYTMSMDNDGSQGISPTMLDGNNDHVLDVDTGRHLPKRKRSRIALEQHSYAASDEDYKDNLSSDPDSDVESHAGRSRASRDDDLDYMQEAIDKEIDIPADDDDIDPDEAGPMEQGETVLRLGPARKTPSTNDKTLKKKKSNHKLLTAIDPDGKGRRKIQIEYIQDKSRRHITFSKRKAGIMKKAYELSTLTGTQVLLLVVSETGTVFTYSTNKLQPLVTEQAGKNLIRECLDAVEPEDNAANEHKHGGTVTLKTNNKTMTRKPSSSNLLRSPRRKPSDIKTDTGSMEAIPPIPSPMSVGHSPVPQSMLSPAATSSSSSMTIKTASVPQTVDHIPRSPHHPNTAGMQHYSNYVSSMADHPMYRGHSPSTPYGSGTPLFSLAPTAFAAGASDHYL